jgi:hypothetical protein
VPCCPATLIEFWRIFEDFEISIHHKAPTMLLLRRLCLLAIILMSSGLANVSSSSSFSSRLAFASVPPSENSSKQDDATATDRENDEIPQLPAADPDADIPSLKFGETLKLDQMGPVIINLDGTTRRIENWDEMTEKEQEVTWRRISKRNEERRKMLLEKMQQEESVKKDKEL